MFANECPNLPDDQNYLTLLHIFDIFLIALFLMEAPFNAFENTMAQLEVFFSSDYL